MKDDEEKSEEIRDDKVLDIDELCQRISAIELAGIVIPGSVFLC